MTLSDIPIFGFCFRDLLAGYYMALAVSGGQLREPGHSHICAIDNGLGNWGQETACIACVTMNLFCQKQVTAGSYSCMLA